MEGRGMEGGRREGEWREEGFPGKYERKEKLQANHRRTNIRRLSVQCMIAIY